MIRQYKAFGLVIESYIHFPELPMCSGIPDVEIKEASHSESSLEELPPEGIYKISESEFWAGWGQLGSVKVTEGRYIWVYSAKKTSDGLVRQMILSSIFSVILNQRMVMQLHASAVKIEDECVLFVGESGAGKSTTATGLVSRGYTVSSDDVCAITLDSNRRAVSWPAYPQIKLRRESLDYFNLDDEVLRSLPAELQKTAYKLETDQFHNDPLPIRKIYFLENSEVSTTQILELNSVEKFEKLITNQFRPGFVITEAQKRAQFVLLSQMANTIQAYTLKRSIVDFSGFDDFLNKLEHTF